MERERKDSETSEDLEVNSCSRETTLAVSSTKEAIGATSPMTAAASAIAKRISTIYDLTYTNTHRWPSERVFVIDKKLT